MGGTRQLMQSMVDAARLMLPRHDETPVHDEMLTPPVAAFNAELADRADALALTFYAPVPLRGAARKGVRTSRPAFNQWR